MVNKLKMPDDGFVMVESHRIIERLYNVFQMPSISSRSWFSIKNSSDKLWQWINQGTRWKFWSSECSMHTWGSVQNRNDMFLFYFIFWVTMKSFSVIWCARNRQNITLTGPTQGRLSYSYPDDSRWAVSGNWISNILNIEHVYRKRCHMSNQHHDPVPKLEWSRK